jgi:hypothetical protein
LELPRQPSTTMQRLEKQKRAFAYCESPSFQNL